jgi:hypothetical protein
VLRIFIGFKNPSHRPGLNPRTLGPVASTVTTTPPMLHIIPILQSTERSRVSSGSIVSDYGLDDRAIGVRSPAGEKDYSSSLCVQTSSEAHPASCTMGTGGPFPGGKSAAGA